MENQDSTKSHEDSLNRLKSILARQEKEAQDSLKWYELAKSTIHSPFLTDAESELLRALFDLERIQVKDYSLRLSVASLPDEPYELVDAKKDELYTRWGPERTIRPAFLEWFFNDKEVQLLIRHKSIYISGCLISPTNSNTIADSQDKLDLSDTSMPFALKFDHCVFQDKISLNRVTARRLTFENCWLFELNGRNMDVEEDICITHCRMPNRTSSRIDISLSQIHGSVKYKDCAGSGMICDESTIGGNLQLENLRLSDNNDIPGKNIVGGTINVERTKIQGNVKLDEIDGVGLIMMDGTTIHRDLKLNEIKFASDVIFNGFHATRLVVEGMLSWSNCTKNDKTQLWLDGGRADTLGGDESMKVGQGNLWLNGFEYRNLVAPLKFNFDKWFVNHASWRRQPYEQYARWLRNESASMATNVLIAAETERRRRQGYNRFWSSLIRVTTGYGYRPLRSLGWIIAFVIVGTVVFSCAYSIGALLPVGGKAPLPTFNAFVYSLDVFIPVIDFQQASYWIPAGNDARGFIVQVYSWVHIALGWFFITLAVAGFTGLIKSKES